MLKWWSEIGIEQNSSFKLPFISWTLFDILMKIDLFDNDKTKNDRLKSSFALSISMKEKIKECGMWAIMVDHGAATDFNNVYASQIKDLSAFQTSLSLRPLLLVFGGGNGANWNVKMSPCEARRR